MVGRARGLLGYAEASLRGMMGSDISEVVLVWCVATRAGFLIVLLRFQVSFKP